MARNFIKIGNTYGNIEILSEAQYRPRKYKCKCLRCGNEFVEYSSQIIPNADRGCVVCREKDRKAQQSHRYEEKLKAHQQYVGREIGNFKIYSVRVGVLYKNDNEKMVIAKCFCKKCGSVTEIPLDRILSGKVKVCRFCAKKNLEIGRTSDCIEGTRIRAIDKTRKTNQNNTSGHKGVSFNRRIQRWRAYIDFKRKRYELGNYLKLEDAVKAREKAEEEIYGNFLKWYAAEYPEAWERRQKYINKKQEEGL